MWEDLAWTVLRVFLGLAMAFGHGLQKMPPSDGFINLVASIRLFGSFQLPFPELMAWMAAIAELGGGFLLAFGLATRAGAGLVICTMIVAAFGAHWAHPIVTATGQASKEMALLYLCGCLPFLFAGSGRFGVDPLIR